MSWPRQHVGTSIRLAWQDTWQIQGARVLVGLQVNAIALVLAAIATHRAGALWTILAYPAFLIATCGFFIVRRLTGWNRLWRREWRIQSPPAAEHIGLSLTTKGPVVLMYYVELEVTCYVRDPAGSEFEADTTRLFRGTWSCTYPSDFTGAPALTPGTYVVTWKERKPPQTGNWRVIEAFRIKDLTPNPIGTSATGGGKP